MDAMLAFMEAAGRLAEALGKLRGANGEPGAERDWTARVLAALEEVERCLAGVRSALADR